MNVKLKSLSIIIPFYNERGNLNELHQELKEVLKENNLKNEIVYIDDGSTDDSLTVLKKAIKKNKAKNISVKILKLPKNLGQTPAIAKGIKYATGQFISFLDADLQNDPKDLNKILDKIAEGYDAVFGWRRKRKDSILKSFTAKGANFLIRIFFNIPLHDVGCSIKVVKRELLQDLTLFGETHRILPLLILRKSAKVTEIEVSHKKRIHGKSHYGFSRIFKLIPDLVRIKFSKS